VIDVAIDAVDGSSTGTEVPSMWVLLRPPRFGGALGLTIPDRLLAIFEEVLGISMNFAAVHESVPGTNETKEPR
jgi:hypothetical protein